MGKIVNQVETGFFVRINEWEKVYAIEDSCNLLCAIVWRKFGIQDNGIGKLSKYFKIEYDLQFITGRNFNEQEIRMISYYYHNLVRTLTDDIQTIYTDNIDERFQLPFTSNILHIRTI